MPRNKKRVQLRKKRPAKKIIKRPPHQPTAEENAKRNDMMKMLLGRGIMPQQPQQQAQQNDKLQEKLDAYNKLIVEARKKNDMLESQLKQRKNELDEENAETKTYNEQMNAMDTQQKVLEKKIKRKEAREKALKEKQDRIEKLEERKKELDGRTKEHKIKEETIALENQIKEKEQEIKQLEMQEEQNRLELEKNKAFNAYQLLEEENKIKQAQVDAQELTLKSIKFKKADVYYQEAYKKNLELTIKAENLNRAINLEKDRQSKEAEVAAMNQFMVLSDNTNKSTPIKTRMTKAIVDKNIIDVEYEEKKIDVDNLKEQKIKTHQLMIENDNKLAETKALQNTIESETYQQKENELAQERQAVADKQANIEHTEKALQNMKEIKRLEAQNKALNKIDIQNINPEMVSTEIETMTEQMKDVIEDANREHEQRLALERQKTKFNSVFEDIMNRYEGQYKDAAINNLMTLISQKTRGRLPSDVMDYNLDNLTKATNFISMVGDRNHELLLNDDMLNDFVTDNSYKDFDWKVD